MARTRGGRRHAPNVERALDIARMVRGESNSIVGKHIPDRDTVDRYGNDFEGLSRMKLKYRDLTANEQATNSTDDRVLASGSTNPERAVDTAHVKDGAITKAKTNIGPNTRWASNEINVPGLGDNPNNDEGKAVDVKSFGDFKASVGDRIGNKADKSDIKNWTLMSEVEAKIKRMVKKNARTGKT